MTCKKVSQYFEKVSFDTEKNEDFNNSFVLTESNKIYDEINRLLSIDKKDVNSYLDSFRKNNKKFDLENEDDFDQVIRIIKNVSFFNVGDYAEKNYCSLYNDDSYDIFSNNLSKENYNFLYEIFYKYNMAYINNLYFNVNEYNKREDVGYYDFPGNGYDEVNNTLALPIRSKFSELFYSNNLSEYLQDERYFKFLVGNLSEFDLENSDLGIDDFILILDNNLIHEKKYLSKIIEKLFKLDSEKFQEYLLSKFTIKGNISDNSKFTFGFSELITSLVDLNNNGLVKITNTDLLVLINGKLIDDLIVLKQYSYDDIKKFLEFLFYLEGSDIDNCGNFDKYNEEERNLIIKFLFENDYEIEGYKFWNKGKMYIFESLISIYNKIDDGKYKDYILEQLKGSYNSLDTFGWGDIDFSFFKAGISLNNIIPLVSKNYSKLEEKNRDKYIQFLNKGRQLTYEKEKEIISNYSIYKSNTNLTLDLFLELEYYNKNNIDSRINDFALKNCIGIDDYNVIVENLSKILRSYGEYTIKHTVEVGDYSGPYDREYEYSYKQDLLEYVLNNLLKEKYHNNVEEVINSYQYQMGNGSLPNNTKIYPFDNRGETIYINYYKHCSGSEKYHESDDWMDYI